MNRRSVGMAAAAFAAGGLVTVIAVALLHGPSSRPAARPARAATTTTLTSDIAATNTSTTSSTAATPPPIAIGPVGPPRPATNPAPPAAPTATAAQGSPWPPGTTFGYEVLTGEIVFTPEEFTNAGRISYTATLTNPTDHWVFVRLTEPWGFSVYLYTPGTEAADMIPAITKGVPSTAPEFQHQTAQGVQTGLLLAPHAAYSFSGPAFGGIETYASADYVIDADIIFTPVGVADATSVVVRGAGSFTMLVPPPTTTMAPATLTTG